MSFCDSLFATIPHLVPRNASDLLRFKEELELAPELTREVVIPRQYACFSVPLLRPFREVRGRDKRQVLVHQYTLGVPGNTLQAIERDGPRIVVDLGPLGPRPLLRETSTERS